LGDEIIQKKKIFSILLLLSLGIIFNISFNNVSAVDQNIINNSSNSSSNNNITSLTNKVAVANQTIKTNSSNTTIIVNGLTLSMLNDGISRVQTFYNKYDRLPIYVSYGSRHIPIATFEKNLVTGGLTLKVSPNRSSISSLARSLTVGSTSKYDTAVRLFNWVRDNLGYTFYYGTRYGAAGTLKTMTGNCCDTANLIVALERYEGIKSRFIHGYCQFKSGTWYDHVWAQIYVNGKWHNADGISYHNSLGVITNWNTSTYKLEGIYNKLPF
jgi:hypothetical protein